MFFNNSAFYDSTYWLFPNFYTNFNVDLFIFSNVDLHLLNVLADQEQFARHASWFSDIIINNCTKSQMITCLTTSLE